MAKMRPSEAISSTCLPPRRTTLRPSRSNSVTVTPDRSNMAASYFESRTFRKYRVLELRKLEL
jgi:hypothetical protein